MTKFEWERELKGLLKSIPRQEVDKILQYYSELFADRYEEGKSESQIIREFGSPSDIAGKVLADYSVKEDRDDYSEYRRRQRSSSRARYEQDSVPPRGDERSGYEPPRHEPSGYYSRPPRRGLSTSTIVLIIVLSPLILGAAAAIIGIAVGLWAASLSLIVASFAMPIAGVANLFVLAPAVAEIGFLANLGVSIAVIGIGFVGIVITISLFKQVVKLTKWMFVLIAKMFGYRGDRAYA